MAQTAVDWLVDKLYDSNGDAWENASAHKIQISIDIGEYFDLLRKSKQMEREQHGDTWDEAIKAHEKRGNVTSRSICDFDDYYTQTYGNNNKTK